MKEKFKIHQIIALISILFVAAVLRLYKIREYLTFLGDQGRDVLVIKRMLLDHELTLLGPITSVGSIFLGPLYYYLMAPFLYLAHFDPVGPAIMIVIFSLLTIVVLYKICIEYFSFPTFLFAAILYSTSPLVLIHSRFSWNPNAVPLFALLTIYALCKVVVDGNDRWLFVVGLCLGALLQFHYLTLIFVPIIGICLFLRGKINWKYYGFLAVGIGITLFPFLLFELRHGFINTQTALRFVSKTDATGPTHIAFRDFAHHLNDVFIRLFWRLVVIKNAEITKVFIISLFAGLFMWWQSIKEKKQMLKTKSAFLVLGSWFLVGIFLYSLYQGAVYDYYFVTMFPLPFLMTGIALTYLWQYRAIGKALSIIVISAFVVFHLESSPFQYEANNQVEQTKRIAQFVYEEAGGKPYNFALIADKNSDHAYRYFLELLGPRPVEIENPVADPNRTTVTEQLLVVCEEKVCQPLGHPIWQIAGYGRAEIAAQWQRGVVKVFKLVPYAQ